MTQFHLFRGNYIYSSLQIFNLLKKTLQNYLSINFKYILSGEHRCQVVTDSPWHSREITLPGISTIHRYHFYLWKKDPKKGQVLKKKKIGKGERKTTGKDDSIKGYTEATTVKTENWSQMICTIDSQTRPFVYTRNTQTRRAFPK